MCPYLFVCLFAELLMIKLTIKLLCKQWTTYTISNGTIFSQAKQSKMADFIDFDLTKIEQEEEKSIVRLLSDQLKPHENSNNNDNNKHDDIIFGNEHS